MATLIDKRPPCASKKWTIAWICWIGSFFALELPPLFMNRPQDTLSDHVWAWFGIPRKAAPTGKTRFRRFGLLTLLAWLVAHFLTGDEF